MKKISLIVMSCMIACGLLANHGIVRGGEMSPKVEDTVSIAKKITDSQWLSNNSDTLEVDTAGEDSVVNVVAYFCKGDTCEYWIYENEWKVDGKDTVKTLGVSTQVRLVVNDSTSKGYKMSYTFLDVKADSVGDNFRDKMMAMVAERTAKSVIGTTINFETDEYGSITKITNLSQIKKQAKALFKASMKDIAAMPIMQAMKKAIEKAVDQDAQTSEYLSVTCFEDGWPSSVLKQNKTVMAGRGKLKQKLIEACRFAQCEK